MKREDGFYWVKLYGRWQPAEYRGDSGLYTPYWQVIGFDEEFFDRDFDEIGAKIEKPED